MYDKFKPVLFSSRLWPRYFSSHTKMATCGSHWLQWLLCMHFQGQYFWPVLVTRRDLIQVSHHIKPRHVAFSSFFFNGLINNINDLTLSHVNTVFQHYTCISRSNLMVGLTEVYVTEWVLRKKGKHLHEKSECFMSAALPVWYVVCHKASRTSETGLWPSQIPDKQTTSR